MILEELSFQECRFPTVIETSKSIFEEKVKPPDLDFAACFYSFAQRNNFPSQDIDEIEQPQPLKTPEENRHEALKKSLLKLSTLDIPGKEHIEDYLRHQYRRNFQANTIRSNYSGLSCFFQFLNKKGRTGIKEITKTDLEAFIEYEQDKGLSISTVKSRLVQAIRIH